MKDYRTITFAGAGLVDLMTNSADSGIESDLRRAPANGVYEIRVIATNNASTHQILAAGGTEVPEQTPVPAGGTADQYPNFQDSTPIQFTVMKDDLIKHLVRATGASQVMATYEFVAL